MIAALIFPSLGLFACLFLGFVIIVRLKPKP